MNIIDVTQGTDEWKQARYGKITGTRLEAIYSARAWTKEDLHKALEEAGIHLSKTAKKEVLEAELTDDIRTELLAQSPRKIGFYETIAERLGLPRDDENRMDRGLRLEAEVRQWFEATYHKQVVEVGICENDIDSRIIQSPDGLVLPYGSMGPEIDSARVKAENMKFTEAIEIKCLSPARHIQAMVEKRVPDEYWAQKMQYFVVNQHLETLYWIFHDPGIAVKPYYVIEVHRSELGDWPQRLLEFQLVQLREMDKIVEELAF